MSVIKITIAMLAGLLFINGCVPTASNQTLDFNTKEKLNSKSEEVWTHFAY